MALSMWPVAEWEFYQVSPDEVHLYRHKDGWVVKAQVAPVCISCNSGCTQVQDAGASEVQQCTQESPTGGCNWVQGLTLYIKEYMPLYVVNQLRLMLNLTEDS